MFGKIEVGFWKKKNRKNELKPIMAHNCNIGWHQSVLNTTIFYADKKKVMWKKRL